MEESIAFEQESEKLTVPEPASVVEATIPERAEEIRVDAPEVADFDGVDLKDFELAEEEALAFPEAEISEPKLDDGLEVEETVKQVVEPVIEDLDLPSWEELENPDIQPIS